MVALTLALIVVLPLGGCTKKKLPPRFTMGVMLRVGENSYFEAMEYAMREEAAREHVHLITVHHNRMKEESPGDEQSFREIFTTNLQALLIIPENEDMAVRHCIPHIQEANRKNVSVILVHNTISEDAMNEKGASVKCTVACNNRQGGELAGKYIAQSLKGKGTVLIMGESDQAWTARNRREGCREVLARYPSIRVIESPYSGWERQKAFTNAAAMFKRHKDIDGVFGFSDPIALGVIDAVNFTGVRKPFIVGFDGSQEGIAAVKEGRMAATVDQDPREIGKLAVRCALQAIQGKALPPYCLTNTEIITEEKMMRPFHFR
jgi:ribose transport system permease protein